MIDEERREYVNDVTSMIRKELLLRRLGPVLKGCNVDTVILVPSRYEADVKAVIIEKNASLGIHFDDYKLALMHWAMVDGYICLSVPWLKDEEFEIRTRFSINNLKYSPS
jgi:hypothetical protein